MPTSPVQHDEERVSDDADDFRSWWVSTIAERYALLPKARERLPEDQRLQNCHRARINAALPVELHETPSGTRYFTNVQTCGRVYCPVCGPRITSRRYAETVRLAQGAADHGMTLHLVTLTHGHDVTDSLRALLDAQREALGHMGRGKGTWKNKLGFVGTRRALDLVHGASGWHPHQHVLMLLPEEREAAEVREAVTARWARSAARAGLQVHPSGITVLDITASPVLAGYLFKLGTRPDSTEQHSRTLYQLLRAAAGGDDAAGALWVEAAHAMRGRRVTVTSPHLRNLAQLSGDGDDEQLAAPASGTFVTEFRRDEWRELTPSDLRALLSQPIAREAAD